MACRKFPHLIIVLLLTASYCATVPLLSVVHTHHALNGPRAAAFAPEAKDNAGKENPLFCAVCFRLNSTQTVSAHTPGLPAVHPGYEIFSEQPETAICPFLAFTSQGRAPPFQIL
ncbi:MAG TPA: hypothetical protein VI215_07055 [Bacteroidota bacterium]|jgi:hypothetical protein